MPSLGTALYRFIAWIAARQLGTLDPVLSVYTRRSVACDEVAFGRSDIDLHILIKPLPDLQVEAEVLKHLSIFYARLKRVFPCLGDCNVSTRAELECLYRNRPYTWYRDRGWLRLYGEEFDRPHGTLTTIAERDSLLWWFFWAWERLPGFFRAGDVRTCCNLFLDMVNVYGLYVGAFHMPKRRAEVLRYWQTLCPTARESQTIARGFATGFRGGYRPLLPWLYSEGLKLGDALSLHMSQTLEGGGCGTTVRSQVPFSFAPRTYLLVDPLREEQVTPALAAMRHDSQVFVTTEPILKLSFLYRNPWEYYAIRAHHQGFPIAPPPDEALRRVLRLSLHKELPRSAGFSIGRKADRSRTIGPQYAQYRLYAEHGQVVTSAEQLRQQYQLHYGAWPYKGVATRDVYFLHDYPVACRAIDDVSRQLR
jgi:predicted nucleotidyltransferase